LLKIYGFYWTIKFIPHYLVRLYRQYFKNSYSQYGEDLIIENLLRKKIITYIDIGSNHPQKFNNSYHFYLNGSHGLVVEPNKELINLHRQKRPFDISLNIGISNKLSSRFFYQLYPDVASTFSKTESEKSQNNGAVLISQNKINTNTLKNIMKKYFPTHQIDLLSVDTEGHDMKVLTGNDWEKYRPTIICVETLHDTGVHQYLLKQKYIRVFQNPINSIYETISGR